MTEITRRHLFALGAAAAVAPALPAAPPVPVGTTLRAMTGLVPRLSADYSSDAADALAYAAQGLKLGDTVTFGWTEAGVKGALNGRYVIVGVDHAR